MTRLLTLLLFVGLSLLACGEPSGPADGTLAISTSTGGRYPDPDGFQLTIDDIDTLPLLGSGAAEVSLSPGRHTLQLLGVAAHCTVASGASVAVDIAAGHTTAVTFAVNCPGAWILVATTTTGLDPDQDGYVLTIDDVDTLVLQPTGALQTTVIPGPHTLRLLGGEQHCSVAPGTVLDLDLAPESTTQVDFEVDCPLTGASVTVTTTGLSLDLDGYRVMVDGSDSGAIGSNDTAITRLQPGNHTIGLASLAPNCALIGASVLPVTIVNSQAVAVQFAVVCSSVSGMITVALSGALGLGFEGMVDGVARFPIGDPVRMFFSNTGQFADPSAGPHVVSLNVPPGCQDQSGPQSVTMPDTVTVTFLVTCASGLRVTTRITGPVPADYFTWTFLCSDYWCDGVPFYTGQLAPNDTLVYKPGNDTYWVGLTSQSSNCVVTTQHPANPIGFVSGATVDVVFQITCS